MLSTHYHGGHQKRVNLIGMALSPPSAQPKVRCEVRIDQSDPPAPPILLNCFGSRKRRAREGGRGGREKKKRERWKDGKVADACTSTCIEI